MMNGVQPAVFFVLPMLGKHPDEYPRFRDCFVADTSRPDLSGCIHVYMRIGGGNRESYKSEIEKLRKIEGFVTDYNDKDDNTFASFVYKVPKKWQEDFDSLVNQRYDKVSDEYIEKIKEVFPKIANDLSELFIKAKAKS